MMLGLTATDADLAADAAYRDTVTRLCRDLDPRERRLVGSDTFANTVLNVFYVQSNFEDFELDNGVAIPV